MKRWKTEARIRGRREDRTVLVLVRISLDCTPWKTSRTLSSLKDTIFFSPSSKKPQRLTGFFIWITSGCSKIQVHPNMGYCIKNMPHWNTWHWIRQVRKSLHDTIPKLLSILRLWFWIWSSVYYCRDSRRLHPGGRKNSWVKAKGKAAYAFTQRWLWQEPEIHLRPQTAQGTWPKAKQCGFLAFSREQKCQGQNSALTEVYTCRCEYWFYKSW